jgi:hypothetical protein
MRVIKTIPCCSPPSTKRVLRAARVWGDSARRVAQYLTHYFHTAVEEPFRRRGLADNQAYEAAIREVGLRMGRSGEQTLAWLFRRHSETFMRQHAFDHAETALEQAGVHAKSAQHPGAAAFADLSGYTRLTEESGDEAAARVSLTLARLVSEVAARHSGEVVKMLGDGVHFHFNDPHAAVMASLEIVDAVRPRGSRPLTWAEAGPLITTKVTTSAERSTSQRDRIPAGPDQCSSARICSCRCTDGRPPGRGRPVRTGRASCNLSRSVRRSAMGTASLPDVPDHRREGYAPRAWASTRPPRKSGTTSSAERIRISRIGARSA